MQYNRQWTHLVVILLVISLFSSHSKGAGESAEQSLKKEKELIAILRSDAPPAEKAIACKKLAIHGSSEAVPDLAPLLLNPQLSSWARIALEVIPGEAADNALRNAVGSLKGKYLVGTLNSIGFRQDTKAVELLSKYLEDKDEDVASAAAVALGHIGNSAATQKLRKSLAISSSKVRSAVAEACILCAERYYSAGKSVEATEIYDEVRQANVPKQRVLEATRGAILARNDKGIPLLLEQFQSSDKKLFQIALTVAREFPGSKVDKALVTEMVRAKPEKASLIIQAMADRRETVVLSAILNAAMKGPKQVRLSAIHALGRVGDISCLTALLDIGIEPDADLSLMAKTTLAVLQGEKINQKITENLSNSTGKMYPLLLELVGMRRIQAIPLLLKALTHSDENVRHAALVALGETVTYKELSVLISQVVTPKYPDDELVAQKALKAASIRMPDREACAVELAKAYEQTSSITTKSSLLQTLGAVGGTKALETIAIAAKSENSDLQDVSSRLLGKWMTIDAAPVLLDLAKTVTPEKYKIRAMRGYIRITRQFTIASKERAEMCQKALDASDRTAEKKLVLQILRRYPNLDTFKLAVNALQNSELSEDATEVALHIAWKINLDSEALKKLVTETGLKKVKLEIVKAEYGSGTTQKDVTEVIQKHAGDFLLISLSSLKYNACFGGDPAPGVTKQLKIQYRIDGKEGEASFEENALIILPMPK